MTNPVCLKGCWREPVPSVAPGMPAERALHEDVPQTLYEGAAPQRGTATRYQHGRRLCIPLL